MKTDEELRARICSLEIQLDKSKREIEQQREEFLSKGAKATNMLCDADARIADLEEAKEQLASPYMDGYEAAKEEYRPQIIALEEQLAATRKQLEELRAEYIVTLDNLSAAYESVRAQWNLGYAEGSQEVKHWRANHDNVVKKLRLFTQREDLPVDRLPAYEHVLELEKKLAETNNRERLISKNLDFERELHAKTEAELAATRKQLAEAQSSDSVTVRYDLSPLKTEEAIKAKVRELGWLDPDAAESLRRKLAEAQAPHINIAHSYVQEVPDHCDRITWRGRYFHLHGINSIVAIDAALDTAIASAIEPYRKDAERFQELLSRVGDDSGPTIVKIEGWSDEYPGYAWFADLSQEQVIAELE